MKTNFILRVHSFGEDTNLIIRIIRGNEWFANIKRSKGAGFNLNFFAQGVVRYR